MRFRRSRPLESTGRPRLAPHSGHGGWLFQKLRLVPTSGPLHLLIPPCLQYPLPSPFTWLASSLPPGICSQGTSSEKFPTTVANGALAWLRYQTALFIHEHVLAKVILLFGYVFLSSVSTGLVNCGISWPRTVPGTLVSPQSDNTHTTRNH